MSFVALKINDFSLNKSPARIFTVEGKMGKLRGANVLAH